MMAQVLHRLTVVNPGDSYAIVMHACCHKDNDRSKCGTDVGIGCWDWMLGLDVGIGCWDWMLGLDVGIL